MRRIICMLVLGGLVAFSASFANAQSSITLISSSANIGFSANGSGGLTVSLGGCGVLGCTLSGNASGTGSVSNATGFTLTSASGPANFTAGGGGSFSTSAVIGFTLNTTTGNLTGTLSNLTFTQASASTNGQVTISGTFNVTGGASIPVSGMVMIGANHNINVTAGGGASVSGGVTNPPPVPEPATAFLLGSGLLGLGGIWRRRQRVAS